MPSAGRQLDRLALMFGDTYTKDMSNYLTLFKAAQKIIFDLGNLVDYTYTGSWNTTLTATSFADNTLDRKSSSGYTIKLIGGPIAWKANKQDTVTTSTTEAELLALSQVAKEAIFVSRLLRELNITLDDRSITINCNNKQTIRLVTEEAYTIIG